MMLTAAACAGPDLERQSIAAEMIAAAHALGATTALIRPHRDTAGCGVDFRRGRAGVGALVIVDDATASGPSGFSAEDLELLEQAHGIFVVADPGEDDLTTLITTARGAVTGVVLTSASRAEAWSLVVIALAPRTIRMTSIGAPIVGYAGAA